MARKRISVPLGLALTLPLLVVLGGGTALVSFLSLQSGQRTADAVVSQLSGEVARAVGERLANLMAVPAVLNQVNANALASGLLKMDDPARRDRFFAGQMTAFPQVSYSYYGREDGSFYGARRNDANLVEVIHNDGTTGGNSVYFSIDGAGNPVEAVAVIAKFDCRTRPWYKAAAVAGKPVFSEIYRHFVYQDLAITAAQPVTDSRGRLEGVLGVDFRLDRLNGLLAAMTPVEGSTITVVEAASGLLVANSLGQPNHGGAGAEFRRFSETDLEHPYLGRVFAQLGVADATSADVRQFRFWTGTEAVRVESFAFRAANLAWRVVVTLPQAVLTREVDENIRNTLALSLLTVMLSILLGLGVVRAALRSLNQVAVAADRIAHGEWNYPTPAGSFRELDRLARSFDTMAGQLKSSITRLEETVAARTGELARKNQELAQANATKDKFFALVGHDLLGPVDAIARLLEALADPAFPVPAEEVPSIHKELALSSRQVFHLLENLLQWAQSQRGEIRFHPEPTDLSWLVGEVLSLLAPRAAAKGLHLEFDGAAWARCDAEMIRTVVRNLVSNALKFSHAGGTVRVTLVLTDETVEVAVRDEGVGIPPARLDTLFQLGAFSHGVGTAGEKGSGLGLVLCQEFLSRHGSTLTVESKVGQGSVFRFKLALAKAVP